MSIGILEGLMRFDDHIDSQKPNSISVTTLLGSNYKGKLYLNRNEKDDSLVKMMYKRSSFIGTAIHSRAEYIYSDTSDMILEQFVERQIAIDGTEYTIAGSFDGIIKVDGKWYMFDYKSFYGNKRTAEALAKDAMQMSLYRWIFEKIRPDITIEDTAYSVCISQSNNYMEEIPVVLTDSSDIDYFIEEKLYAISETETADCFDNIKYSPCQYCSYANCSYRK